MPHSICSLTWFLITYPARVALHTSVDMLSMSLEAAAESLDDISSLLTIINERAADLRRAR